LKDLSTPSAKVLRDGKMQLISSKDVTIGDIVILEAGDSVCADGRLISAASLQVQESALTGESLSVEKQTDALVGNDIALGDRTNMVYSGSFVTYGRGSFVITGIGMSTEVGKIAALLKETKEKRTPLQLSLDDFGKKLSVGILAVCAVLFGLSIFRGETPMDAFMFAVALAVAAIPEALSSIVTIVLAFSTQNMVKENAIIRKLQAVEGLGSVSIICSDKTGTLTQNKMTVKEYYVDGKVTRVEDTGAPNRITRKLVYASILCNDASSKDGVEIGDPTEVALVQMAQKLGMNDEQIRHDFERLGEVPFDSDRKLMSVAYRTSKYVGMATKGAVDVILERVVMIECENGVRPIMDDDIVQIKRINEEMSSRGLRVLAFATKRIESGDIGLADEEQLTFLGLTAMIDPPRVESADAVAKCISAGIRPIMITGDHKITASAIAREIGILRDDAIAIEGREIEPLTDEELKELVPKVSVYARVSPEHKIRIVRAWQELGYIVSMTGDGVNDAPALKQADVGVAMGITGTEVSKDAASMILTDDNFSTIVKAIESGRNVYNNIKKSIQFLLSGNTAGIISVVYACFAGLASPFQPVHLLFINLLTDSLPAIALGLDPHDSGVMKEKPRPKNEGILTKDFMISVVTEGFIIAAATMVAYYVGLQTSKGAATTMAFATLCLSRLLHGYSAKSKKTVLFKKQMWNNKYLQLAFLAGFVLLNAVLLIPGIHGFFRVEALSILNFATIYISAIVGFVVVQLAKLIRK